MRKNQLQVTSFPTLPAAAATQCSVAQIYLEIAQTSLDRCMRCVSGQGCTCFYHIVETLLAKTSLFTCDDIVAVCCDWPCTTSPQKHPHLICVCSSLRELLSELTNISEICLPASFSSHAEANHVKDPHSPLQSNKNSSAYSVVYSIYYIRSFVYTV